MSEWLKLPGLFHRFELEQVIDADGHHAYRFEQAGTDARRRELIAVYCRRFDVPGGAVATTHSRAVQPVNEDCVGGVQ